MTDIVERLHIAANSDWGQFVGDNLIRKAADRIEELEAELETLRGERIVGYAELTEAATTHRRFTVYVPAFGEPAAVGEIPAILILQPEEAPE